MTTYSITEFSCPSCDSSIDVIAGQAEIRCQVCNSQFSLAAHLCPSCAFYHTEEQTICEACAAPLVRLCRNCHTVNWSGNADCISCSQPIDLLSQVQTQSGQSTASRLARQMADAQELKDIEADSSKKRMAELMAIEEARQAEVRRQRARTERHERRMLLVVFASVLLFLLGLLAYALLSNGG